MNITMEQAHTVFHAAMEKAKEIGVMQNIAIVDCGANLTFFGSMDNAWIGSIDIAIRKAKTARYFDMDTKALGKMSQAGEPLYGIEVSNGGLIIFGGGIPLKIGDEVIGAIGVSGGNVEQDIEVAEAGVNALKG